MLSRATTRSLSGPVKIDKTTKKLTSRIKPGDIALIYHCDLDAVAAEMLCRGRVKAVINIASSITGRYPNSGPQLLQKAGIKQIDEVGEQILDNLAEGDEVTLQGARVYKGNVLLAEGRELTDELIKRQSKTGEEKVDELLEDFVQNTLEYALREKNLLLTDVSFPPLLTTLSGKHVLIVARGQSYRQDLEAIKHYINEVRPVLIGVDGGSDALLEFGYIPHIVVGDMDSVSDTALIKAGEAVVHAYPDGRAPGLKRTKDLRGEDNTHIVSAHGTSEDIAMLLSYEKEAELIAAVGTHSGVIDFLEKGRKGMASTFLVRLKVGRRLVDAKGISQLYRRRIPGRYFLMASLAAFLPVIVLGITNTTLRHLFRLLLLRLGF